VKKYFLSISILFCFLIAVSGTGKCSVSELGSAISFEWNGCSILEVNYPHTEFEVNHHNISVSNNCHQQKQQNSIVAAEFSDRYFHKSYKQHNESSCNLACKQYLTHIYPSHNFW